MLGLDRPHRIFVVHFAFGFSWCAGKIGLQARIFGSERRPCNRFDDSRLCLLFLLNGDLLTQLRKCSLALRYRKSLGRLHRAQARNCIGIRSNPNFDVRDFESFVYSF